MTAGTLTLAPPCRHVKTLVLDLDDVLVHSDWARSRGWRTFKRPGCDDFLRQLAARFELVRCPHGMHADGMGMQWLQDWRCTLLAFTAGISNAVHHAVVQHMQ